MSATIQDLSNALGKEASGELDGALRTIRHCVDQLTDDQLWWRPSESMNSIANLLLHLCGNLRQWIVSGVGSAGVGAGLGAGPGHGGAGSVPEGRLPGPRVGPGEAGQISDLGGPFA